MADDSRIESGDPIAGVGPPGSMKRALAAGAGWMTTLQLASKVIEVGFAAVLARILVPADFGVIAGAGIFIQFASLLVEIGIGATIVQLPGLTRDDLRTAGTLVLINSVVYFLLAQAFAPVAGAFLGIEGVTEVVRVLALIFLIQAFGIVPENMLVRRLDVRRVMIVQLVARVIGTGGIGVALAWAGWGYWSLVAATLAETGIKATLLVATVRPPARPLLTRAGAKRLLRRGTGFSIARILNFFAVRADNALVGRTMDAAALGYYSRAYNLMSLPADLYGRVAERLIFPAMAQVQDDTPRLRRAFLRGLELTATIGLPLSALLALLAPEVITFILGPRWGAVIAPFAVLSTATYLRLGAKISGSLQRAKAATGALISNQVVYAAMVIGGCLLAYPYGIVAVAGAVSLAVFIFYCVVNYNACRIVDLDFVTFLRAHAHGAALALLATLVAAPVVLWMRESGAPALATLAVAGAAMAALGAVLVWLRPKWLIGGFAAEMVDDAARLVRRKLARAKPGS